MYGDVFVSRIRLEVIAISICSLQSWLSLQSHPLFISPGLFIFLAPSTSRREDLQWLSITRERFYGPCLERDFIAYWRRLESELDVEALHINARTGPHFKAQSLFFWLFHLWKVLNICCVDFRIRVDYTDTAYSVCLCSLGPGGIAKRLPKINMCLSRCVCVFLVIHRPEKSQIVGIALAERLTG